MMDLICDRVLEHIHFFPIDDGLAALEGAFLRVTVQLLEQRPAWG